MDSFLKNNQENFSKTSSTEEGIEVGYKVEYTSRNSIKKKCTILTKTTKRGPKKKAREKR